MFKLTYTKPVRHWLTPARPWWKFWGPPPLAKPFNLRGTFSVSLTKAEGQALGRPEVQSLVTKLTRGRDFVLAAMETDRAVEG